MKEFNFDEWLDKYATKLFPDHKDWYITLYKSMGILSVDERWARLEATQFPV